jgi:hypothetical protein
MITKVSVQDKKAVLDLLKKDTEALHFSEELRQERLSIEAKIEEIQDAMFLKSYRSITIKPFIQRVKAYDKYYSENIDAFIGLQATYETYCEMRGEKPKPFDFSKEAVSALKKEIKRLQDATKKSDEQAYIEESINEVMEELGYNLFGHRDIKKKSGTQFRSLLYSYTDHSAVNVTYAPDGKIALEVCGVSKSDDDVDAAIANIIVEDMGSFCEIHPKIEEMLQARGVMRTGKGTTLPPTSEYAVFVNEHDYEITDPACVPQQPFAKVKRRGVDKRAIQR